MRFKHTVNNEIVLLFLCNNLLGVLENKNVIAMTKAIKRTKEQSTEISRFVNTIVIAICQAFTLNTLENLDIATADTDARSNIAIS